VIAWDLDHDTENEQRPELPTDIFDDDAIRKYFDDYRRWQRREHEERVAAALGIA